MGESNREALDLVVEETKEKMRIQNQNIDALDNKAAVGLGIAGVMLTLVASGRVTGSSTSVVLLQILSMGFLAFSLACLILALWVLDWRFPPKPSALVAWRTETPDRIKNELLTKMSAAYDSNAKQLSRKAGWVKASLILILLAALLLVASVCIAARP
jgi:hypothetical protein